MAVGAGSCPGEALGQVEVYVLGSLGPQLRDRLGQSSQAKGWGRGVGVGGKVCGQQGQAVGSQT